MDDIFQDKEDVFGRECGKFIFGFAAVFTESCFSVLVSVLIPPSYILTDSICTNLLQVGEGFV